MKMSGTVGFLMALARNMKKCDHKPSKYNMFEIELWLLLEKGVRDNFICELCGKRILFTVKAEILGALKEGSYFELEA